ncbi:hypothetical protein SRHO_G00173650 [Serrasalmus rhombeus]
MRSHEPPYVSHFSAADRRHEKNNTHNKIFRLIGGTRKDLHKDMAKAAFSWNRSPAVRLQLEAVTSADQEKVRRLQIEIEVAKEKQEVNETAQALRRSEQVIHSVQEAQGTRRTSRCYRVKTQR